MRILSASAVFALGLCAASAFAAKSPVMSLTIKDHAFAPASLTVPAHTRVEIRVHNTRSLPAEFESSELNREKVIPGGTTVSVWIGPLKPGQYKFFDDFNPGVTGHIVVEKPTGETP